jgi:hypothetical protein
MWDDIIYMYNNYRNLRNIKNGIEFETTSGSYTSDDMDLNIMMFEVCFLPLDLIFS